VVRCLDLNEQLGHDSVGDCDFIKRWAALVRRRKSRGFTASFPHRVFGSADHFGADRTLKPDEVFDFAFIDADKVSYDKYFELLLPHMRQSSLLLSDNMLVGGKVVDLGAADENVRALDALNKKLASDPRVESVLLSIADGLNLCRKRSLA
jgi:caffeoyl-CoA O-methyltransferase